MAMVVTVMMPMMVRFSRIIENCRLNVARFNVGLVLRHLKSDSFQLT